MTRADYEKSPKLCKLCKGPIAFEKRWGDHCCHSHAASTRNAGRRRHGKPSGVCLRCGSPKSGGARTYCSNECHGEIKWEQTKQRIRDGGKTSSRSLKKFLLEEQGFRCSICGRQTWRTAIGVKVKIPLVMDHINGNAEDNSLGNLRLVCGNCDMLLPTYKSKNLGNGRHKRRQRYAEGKSY